MHFIGNTSTPDYWRDAKIFEIVFVIKHIRWIYGCWWLHKLQSKRKRKQRLRTTIVCQRTDLWVIAKCQRSYIYIYILWVFNGIFDLAKQTFIDVVCRHQLILAVVRFFICIGAIASLYRDGVLYARCFKKKNPEK